MDFGGSKDDLGRLQGRLPTLVGYCDVRQRVDQLTCEVSLRTFHKRRHDDREANASGDAGNGDQRLPGANTDMRQRDVNNEAHGVPGRLVTTRTR